MQDLENEFRLREIDAWPIAALHMHCAVLEIDANAKRSREFLSLVIRGLQAEKIGVGRTD